ncbi:BMP family ABC transporter substrate-binding protein [Streptomyces sp. NPDC050095]|uniref:BMP family lipoprotein n=1 Tax=unclassified Streptomyces TaxID=2593676 RepID=UPI003417F719
MRRVSRIAVAGTATASLALALAACGGTSSDASSSAGGKDGKGAKGLAIAYDVGGKGDQSFNDAAYQGLEKAKAKFGYQVADQEPKDGESDDDKAARLVNLAKAGYNPVVGIGYSYAPAVKAAAAKFPNTTFGIVDDASVQGKNIADLVFQENEVSYLAGVTAALKTKTNHVGFVGGVDNALINKFRAGFEQGVKDTKKGVKVDVQFLDEDPAKGFASPDLGKAAAEKQLEDGADVVYHAAGLSGQGVIEAAAAAKKYAIGVDSDQYSQKPLAAYKKYIITSATKGVAESIFKLAESVENKAPETGVITGNLKSGEVSLADSNPEFKNDSKLQAALKKAETGIVDGTIKVAAK